MYAQRGAMISLYGTQLDSSKLHPQCGTCHNQVQPAVSRKQLLGLYSIAWLRLLLRPVYVVWFVEVDCH